MSRVFGSLCAITLSLFMASVHADAPFKEVRSEKPVHYVSPVPDFSKSAEPLTEDQKKLRERVLDEALIEFGEERFGAEIHAYVQMILDDGFLQDPQGYLEAWAKARGLTREYRMPEDPARSFFHRYFPKKED